MDVEVAEHLVVGSDGAAGQAAVAAVQDGDGEVARADEAVDGQADSARGQLKAAEAVGRLQLPLQGPTRQAA